jgi:transposase
VQIDLSALPDDAATLHLMLRAVVLQQGELAAENDKLRLLIQRLTRHQFGRRSEQLTPDQLQLALEELEQTIAANQAGQDAQAARRGTEPQPRCPAGTPAALRGGDRRRGPRLSMLRPCAARHRRAED